MKHYELNGLGKRWIWRASSEEEATKMYIKEFWGFEKVEDYENHFINKDIDPEIRWEEVDIEEGCPCGYFCKICVN